MTGTNLGASQPQKTRRSALLFAGADRQDSTNEMIEWLLKDVELDRIEISASLVDVSQDQSPKDWILCVILPATEAQALPSMILLVVVWQRGE
jgi:hypothetical protein